MPQDDRDNPYASPRTVLAPEAPVVDVRFRDRLANTTSDETPRRVNTARKRAWKFAFYAFWTVLVFNILIAVALAFPGLATSRLFETFMLAVMFPGIPYLFIFGAPVWAEAEIHPYDAWNHFVIAFGAVVDWAIAAWFLGWLTEPRRKKKNEIRTRRFQG